MLTGNVMNYTCVVWRGSGDISWFKMSANIVLFNGMTCFKCDLVVQYYF